MEQPLTTWSLKLLAVDDVAPSNETLVNDSYPLIIYTYSYYNNGNEVGENLTDWLLTEEGQKIIASAGYVGLFGELPPLEQKDAYDFNRDYNDATQVVFQFYRDHGLISSADNTVQRGRYKFERLPNRAQVEAYAEGKGKVFTLLFMAHCDGDFDEIIDDWVYRYIRFIVVTREKNGTFEVINEGEVQSFENGLIFTSGEDSHIERFPIDFDLYSRVSFDEHPDAFRGYIPDFAAIDFAVFKCCHGVAGNLTLKNETPYSLQFLLDVNPYLVWFISSDPEHYYYKLAECSGDLRELTEQIVFDAIDKSPSISFTWDEYYFAMQATSPGDVWKIIQHMALSV